MSESYKKLIHTLRKLFEMDKADLDFGIYRIMNQKREEINNFSSCADAIRQKNEISSSH